MVDSTPYPGTGDASLQEEAHQETIQQRRIGLVKTIALYVALVGVLFIIWFYWPSSTSAYEYGKNYQFTYSAVSTSKTNDGREVSSRLFVFEDGTTFASPVESYGRRITMFDPTLPTNSLRIVRKSVPRLEIGARLFDPGGTYDEVQYNMAHVAPQAVTPRVTPENKPATQRKQRRK